MAERLTLVPLTLPDSNRWVIGEALVHVAGCDIAAWNELMKKNQEIKHGTN